MNSLKMNRFEDFVIDQPYQKNGSDLACISAASPNGNHSGDWESHYLETFKTNIREYLRKKQNGRCAYCRLRIHDNEAQAEIEHIVPKQKKAEWMYDTFNLCLSCKSCNTKKGYQKEIIEDNEVTQLPRDSSSYLIIHPYLDQYSQHIELVEEVLYKGLTDKGRYTIELCKLNRFELAAARAEGVIEHDSTLYSKWMLLLVNEENQRLIDNVDKLIKRISELIDEYKELHAS